MNSRPANIVARLTHGQRSGRGVTNLFELPPAYTSGLKPSLGEVPDMLLELQRKEEAAVLRFDGLRNLSTHLEVSQRSGHAIPCSI